MANDYDKYAETGHVRGTYNSHKYVEKPMMREMLPDLSGKKVLMLGCGTGEEVELLLSVGVSDLTGIDLSEASIKVAKENYPGCDFIVCDIHKLPFTDDTFDFVYSSLTVHYSANPSVVFDEVYRVLKKSGQFLFSVGHPLRWASVDVETADAKARVIGYGRTKADKQIVYGDYLSYALYVHSFPYQGETLEFYSGPPSTYFKFLRRRGFFVDDFSESKCTEDIIAENPEYYERFSKIPQFQAFLARK